MSPRHFWNHPLRELARSLAHSCGPNETGCLSTHEFTAFLGRLVDTTAQGPGLMRHRARSLADDVEGMGRGRR